MANSFPKDPARFDPRGRGASDWRCPRCDKLLGRRSGARLHLRHGRNHEYLVSLPATATCRVCGALSELHAID